MSPPPHLQALAKANEFKSKKAQVKREMKAGRLTFDQLLADVPPCCAKTSAFDALQWIPHVGYHSARKLAAGLVSETLPLCRVGAGTGEQLKQRVAAKTRTAVAR